MSSKIMIIKTMSIMSIFKSKVYGRKSYTLVKERERVGSMLDSTFPA